MKKERRLDSVHLVVEEPVHCGHDGPYWCLKFSQHCNIVQVYDSEYVGLRKAFDVKGLVFPLEWIDNCDKLH